MAENNVEPEHEWSDRALDIAEDTLVAMETLLATLRAFEDVLRQQELSVESSTEYCDNFCQVLCTCSTEATARLKLARPKLFIAQPASSFICSRCWPRLVVRPSEGLICNPGSSGTRCALFFSHPRMRSMQNNKDFTRCRSRKSFVRYTVQFPVDALYILPDSVSLKHLSDKVSGFFFRISKMILKHVVHAHDIVNLCLSCV